MGKKVRLAGICYESLVNGPGMRRVFFSQGCKHKCDGCFNPDTHSFNGGEEFDMDYLVKDVLENPLLKGVTFSGGDPFERAEEFSYMAKVFRRENLNVWAFTGYTIEEILEISKERNGFREFLENIDVLVDGRFIKKLSREGLKFRGSSNQRIIDVKKTLDNKKIVLIDEYM